MNAVEVHLDVLPNTRPAVASYDGFIVIVAGDEVFSAMQSTQQGSDVFWRLANGEVAQVPNFILASNRLVPPVYHLAVHV